MADARRARRRGAWRRGAPATRGLQPPTGPGRPIDLPGSGAPLMRLTCDLISPTQLPVEVPGPRLHPGPALRHGPGTGPLVASNPTSTLPGPPIFPAVMTTSLTSFRAPAATNQPIAPPVGLPARRPTPTPGPTLSGLLIPARPTGTHWHSTRERQPPVSPLLATVYAMPP